MSNESTLLRIERKLDKPKPKWVPAFVITDLTGWNSSKMRTARNHDLIEYKSDGKSGYLYNLSSLHPYLIKKQTA